ncbi:MAG: hypothetical protein ACI9RO_001400 [Alteromonas macleodii]|jgi:hypothetical protein
MSDGVSPNIYLFELLIGALIRVVAVDFDRVSLIAQNQSWLERR